MAFMKHVLPEPNSGCWLWTARVDRKGYGQVGSDGRTRSAHRVSYEIYTGPIPGGLCVLHKCDVPSCVNPDHLFLGTKADNNRDKMSKGRHRCGVGEANGNAKLTDEQVREIRAKRMSGQTRVSIAAQYGIGVTQVSRIASGQTRRTA